MTVLFGNNNLLNTRLMKESPVSAVDQTMADPGSQVWGCQGHFCLVAAKAPPHRQSVPTPEVSLLKLALLTQI